VGTPAQFYSFHSGLEIGSLVFPVFPARVVLICRLYLRIRRLAPLMPAHWAMDLMGAIYTLNI